MPRNAWATARVAWVALAVLTAGLDASAAADHAAPAPAPAHAAAPAASTAVAAHGAVVPENKPAPAVAPPAPDGKVAATQSADELAGRLGRALASQKGGKNTAALAHLIAGTPAPPPSEPAPASAPPAHAKPAGHGATKQAGRVVAAHAAAPHEMHWAYDGEAGPQAWARLKPEFQACASGRRQSPIHIEESATLPGPAEPLQLGYRPSTGSVVNNGHTIQVDLEGDNTLTVRGTTYRLVQFHFHHPAEEKVNHKGFAMVVHLVHKSDDGRLAVIAVLMDPGADSTLLRKVFTYMPLDTADRVRLPAGLVDLNELLPQDQRYYQFLGSLTTPPCTEGVLWLVLKQPVTLGRDQLRLFAQQFPNNARPVQALNGRAVREAQ
jgi:carbonic anhydrase